MKSQIDNRKSKILVTGGHSTPAFAVLDELISRGYTKDNFFWVSEKYNQRGNTNPSPEFRTVNEKYEIKFIDIKAGKLVRKWTRKTFIGGIIELFNLFIGFIQGFFIILKNRPDVVLSFGGFLAVPIVFWAKIFGVKVLSHEQTIVTGLANKIIAKFADKILISFKESEKYYPKNKVIFTGNPIRKDIFEVKTSITKNLDKKLPTVYITGGNQGANQINKRIFQIIDKLLENANVIHQTGNSSITDDYMKALKQRSQMDNIRMNRYIVKDYVNASEIGEVFEKSNVVFSRAGANTILEILALGKLAIMLPIPWTSHDEQTKNANIVANTGLGKVIKQTESLSAEEIYEVINEALKHSKEKQGFNGEDLKQCQKNAKDLVVLDAAEKIADLIINL